MREKTMIYLNTWGAYNNGSIGYGWMAPADARNFIEENEDLDGGEFFIADIDNYLGVDFGYLDYCNVQEIIDAIEALEEMDDYELAEVVALMEYLGSRDVQYAIDAKDRHTLYESVDSFYECMDELVDFSGCSEFISRYFDYEAYHRDCMMDAYEASNGVVIC